MYTERFFALLQAGRKVDATEKIQLVSMMTIADPQIKKEARAKFIAQYEKIAGDDEPVDPETIKRDRAALMRKLRGRRI